MAARVKIAGRNPERLWTAEDYPATSIEDLSMEVVENITEVRPRALRVRALVVARPRHREGVQNTAANA